MVNPELQDHLERKVLLVQLDQQAQLVSQAIKELPVQLVIQDHQDQTGNLDHLVKQEIKDKLVHLDHPVNQDQQARLDLSVMPVSRDQVEMLDQLDHLG